VTRARDPRAGLDPDGPISLDLGPAADPIAGRWFHDLCLLRRLVGVGGLPQRDTRTPGDEARIAVFYAVQELIRLLEIFGRLTTNGERARLNVREHGREPRRATIELWIEDETHTEQAPKCVG
jgi:hypothetical protein